MSVFQALSPTDHVIAPKDLFYGTADLLCDVFARWGLETTFLDMTDAANLRKAHEKRQAQSITNVFLFHRHVSWCVSLIRGAY